MQPTPEQAQAYGLLRQQGLTDAGARGWIAMLSGESGPHLDPGAQNLSGTETGGALSPGGFGLAQWNGDRQAPLGQFAAAHGSQPADRATQLLFSVDEAKKKFPQIGALLSDPRATAGQVLDQGVRGYEIPAKPDEQVGLRSKYLNLDYGTGAPAQEASLGAAPHPQPADPKDPNVTPAPAGGQHESVLAGGSDATGGTAPNWPALGQVFADAMAPKPAVNSQQRQAQLQAFAKPDIAKILAGQTGDVQVGV